MPNSSAICTFYLRDRCSRGSLCPFAHPAKQQGTSIQEIDKDDALVPRFAQLKSEGGSSFVSSKPRLKPTTPSFMPGAQYFTPVPSLTPDAPDFVPRLSNATTPGINPTAASFNPISISVALPAPRLPFESWRSSSKDSTLDPLVNGNRSHDVQYRAPCRFFQAGTCNKGESCQFLHETVDHIPIEKLNLDTKNHKLQLSNTKGDVSNVVETAISMSVTATFGAGLEVEGVSISSGSNSSKVTITDLPSNTVAANILPLLQKINKDLAPEQLRLSYVEHSCYVIADLGSHEAALNAVKQLHGTVYRGTALKVHLIRPKIFGAAMQDASRFVCSWFRPSMIAYAHYRDYEDAQMAQGRSIQLNGRKLELMLQEPTHRQRTSFSVVVANLDVQTSEKEIKRALRCDDLTLNRPARARPEGETYAFVRSLFEQNGQQLEDFEILTGKHEKKAKAIVKCTTSDVARDLYNQYNGSKHDFLGNAALRLSLVFSAKFTILKGVYTAVYESLQEVLNNARTEHINSKVFENDTPKGPTVTVRIHGQDKGAFLSAKKSLQKVIAGKITRDVDGNVLWHPLLVQPTAVVFLKKIIRDSKSFVFVDTRLRNVVFYGAPSGIESAMIQLRSEIERALKNQHEISLNTKNLRLLLSGGLDYFATRFGEESVNLDVVKKVLVVHGSTSDIQHAIEHLQTLRTREDIVKKEDDGTNADCPICCCPLESPVKASCGHSYCEACLKTYFESALSSRSLPLKCVGVDSCNKLFSPKMLRTAIPEAQLDQFLQLSFADYIGRRVKEYQYCPTPDCPNIFRATSNGEVVTCSDCVTSVCTACRVEAHDGETCAEFQRNKTEGVQLTQAWKKENGVKACPECGADIQKADGCNHMTCLMCKSHICWVCMRKFVLQTIYDHMRDEHGGIGI